jgi:transcriptional regulator with XRE-family HTH domain
LGGAIRGAREARNLSQRQLAERIGTSRENVGRWERGAAMPGLDRLGPLCDALDVPADYFRRSRDA